MKGLNFHILLTLLGLLLEQSSINAATEESIDVTTPLNDLTSEPGATEHTPIEDVKTAGISTVDTSTDDEVPTAESATDENSSATDAPTTDTALTIVASTESPSVSQASTEEYTTEEATTTNEINTTEQQDVAGLSRGAAAGIAIAITLSIVIGIGISYKGYRMYQQKTTDAITSTLTHDHNALTHDHNAQHVDTSAGYTNPGYRRDTEIELHTEKDDAVPYDTRAAGVLSLHSSSP